MCLLYSPITITIKLTRVPYGLRLSLEKGDQPANVTRSSYYFVDY